MVFRQPAGVSQGDGDARWAQLAAANVFTVGPQRIEHAANVHGLIVHGAAGAGSGRDIVLRDDANVDTFAFDVEGAAPLFFSLVVGGQLFVGSTAVPNAPVVRGSSVTVDPALSVSGNQVVGARGAAVADAAGGATIDAEARAAINALLARVRAHGLIA